MVARHTNTPLSEVENMDFDEFDAYAASIVRILKQENQTNG